MSSETTVSLPETRLPESTLQDRTSTMNPSHPVDQPKQESETTPLAGSSIPKAKAIQQTEIPLHRLSKEEQNNIVLQRLQGIPVEQLKEIISNQLDLEIRLKHKELTLTQDELNKIESQMIVLRKFFDVPSDLKLSKEPNDFTMRYINTLNKSLLFTFNDLRNLNKSLTPVDDPNYNHFNSNFVSAGHDAYSDMSNLNSGHGYRTRSTTSSLRPTATTPYGAGSSASGSSFAGASCGSVAAQPLQSAHTLKNNQNLGCLYRRTDGIVVRLTCPDCQRSNFSSAQGFLNHSRIAHSKEYTSQDAAALKCGEILPVIKQDPEGELSLQSLLKKNLDPNKNLNVNEIYFNGLSNTLNTVHDSVPVKVKSHSRSNSVSATYSANSTTSPSPTAEDKRSAAYSKSEVQFPTESILMKKLVRESKMKKEEYEKLLADTRAPIANAHLFQNEVEDDSDEAVSTVSPIESNRSKAKRRSSRGGINIKHSGETWDEVAVESEVKVEVKQEQEEVRKDKIKEEVVVREGKMETRESKRRKKQ